MTKIDWDKAKLRDIDPGSIIDAPEDFRPSRWMPPQERARRDAERKKAEQIRIENAKCARDYERLKGPARDLNRKRQQGETLSFLDRATLKLWERLKLWKLTNSDD